MRACRENGNKRMGANEVDQELQVIRGGGGFTLIYTRTRWTRRGR